MQGYVLLCRAMEGNVCHILTNGEPLYDAYTTYLPRLHTADNTNATNPNIAGATMLGVVVFVCTKP